MPDQLCSIWQELVHVGWVTGPTIIAAERDVSIVKRSFTVKKKYSFLKDLKVVD